MTRHKGRNVSLGEKLRPETVKLKICLVQVDVGTLLELIQWYGSHHLPYSSSFYLPYLTTAVHELDTMLTEGTQSWTSQSHTVIVFKFWNQTA